jgi:hypothetical protein
MFILKFKVYKFFYILLIFKMLLANLCGYVLKAYSLWNIIFDMF